MAMVQPTTPRRPRVPMATHQHRIVLYTTCYNVLDGVTLTIRKIEQEILAAGHCVCIVTTKSGDNKWTHMDGEHPNRSVIFLDNSIPIPFLNDPDNPDISYHMGFSLSKKVKDRIAEFEPSLIHITVPDCTCSHLIQFAREREIPIMGTYHSNIPEYMNHYPGLGWLGHVLAAFFRHQYNFLQALYVPTPFIKKHLTDHYKMDRVTSLKIWGRGIDLNRFSPVHRSNKFREEMGFSDQDVVICWVGRLVPEKRPDIFCKVIRRLHEHGVPFKALVVGAGPCEKEAKALPNTTFAGWLSGNQLSVAYASSDIFLFPSAVETFGNVTLEAAASGLPLVVEAGCSGHLVNHGINGYACSEHDEEAWFESTLSLVMDESRRKSMSEEGRSFSLQFEKRFVCKKMLDNYSKVTDQFYFEYGGHHANRDEVFQKEDSFTAGVYPRPTVIVFFEYLFICIFQVMYQAAMCLSCIRRPFKSLSSSNQEVSVSTTVNVNDGSSLVSVSPDKKLLSKDPVCSNVLVLHDELRHDSSYGFIEEEDECQSESDPQDHVQNMPDIVFPKLVKSSDDDTSSESTSSLSDESSSARSEACCKREITKGMDLPISHLLTLALMKLLSYQSQVESEIRLGLNSCLRRSPTKKDKRKRKDSSNYAIDLPDIPRSRSDGCDSPASESDMDISPGSIGLRDDRHLSLRKSSSFA